MITLFEKYNEGLGKFYYSVHNDPLYLTKELQKLGASKDIIEHKLWEIGFYIEDILFLGITSIKDATQWQIDKSGSRFKDNGFEYKGTVKLTTEDINDIKAEKEAEKFNL